MKSKRQQPTGSARRIPRCPIVGVGASAGGLEAFTRLLKRLPVDTGFGFVLVQHLDPQHESALTQLLARVTVMPVREVTHNLRVEANRVYVIPPNMILGIASGILQLQSRSQQRTPPRVIDFFFEALAKDQRERAIGVILSGTATDGTLGLEAIKAEGGLTFAQDGSARYDSMPRSAAAAGCVDFVLSPENIAKELVRIAKHPYVAGRTAARSAARALRAPVAGVVGPDSYQKILLLLRNHSGVDFSLYKTATIQRRIARRTVLSRRDTQEKYVDFLHGNPRELDALYSDALINVTSFFRNADAFDLLARRLFQPMLQQAGDEPLRVWVLGCSTGQEAYSLAMLYAECAGKIPRARKLQIFATDLNEANLGKARHGFYAKNLVQDVSPERLHRFFTAEEGGYRVIKPLREQVVFARQNVIGDPPFSRMDLISCRNLMIYLEPSLQKKILPTFHYALKPEGFLFLGASESVGGFTDLFQPIDKRHKIFLKKAAPTRSFQLPVRGDRGGRPVPGHAARAALRVTKQPGGLSEALRSELSAEREADRVTVNQFAPPAVLINTDLQILQFRGPTGAYLEPPTGKASFDLLKMARDGLMLPLRTAINNARKENQTVRKENVPIKQNGRTRAVHLEVVPLKNLKERCFLVLFEEAETPGKIPSPEQAVAAVPDQSSKEDQSSRVVGLESDLAEARDYLQSIQEHQELANEELQASNEEGQSANEELQSLNEELETSKEELESTNEELTTVNEEMVSRNADLNRLNSDLTNLQTSTQLVILLLGRDLTIRRFSAEAEKQFGLLASDVGRRLGSIRHNLDVPGLEALIGKVMASGRETTREVQDRDGHWYLLRIRPYLAADKHVDGAVLVLVDVNAAKEAEQEVSHARDFAEAIIDTVRDPLLILDSDLRVHKANEAYSTTFKISPAALMGRSVLQLHRGQWDVPKLRRLLRDILPRRSSFNNFEITRKFGKIGVRTILLNARMLRQGSKHREKILLGFEDITERKGGEEALRKAEILLSRHAGQLGQQVARRTADLVATNQRLQASIASVSQGQERYRVLLEESQAMQKKLRQVTRLVLTAQEEERKQISRELHDEVVQLLVGINVELAALSKGVPVDNRLLAARIARTQRLVENSVHVVHRFARGLRPAVLDDLGLIPALHAYCKHFAAEKKVKIRLTAFNGVETLDSPRRTMLFRVAQEALTNVGRHACASEVMVGLSKISGAIRMEVSDNGKSFSVKKTLLTGNNKRLGLVGMRERVEMVGGTLVIDSAPGRGTTVRVEVPFNLNPEKIKK